MTAGLISIPACTFIAFRISYLICLLFAVSNNIVFGLSVVYVTTTVHVTSNLKTKHIVDDTELSAFVTFLNDSGIKVRLTNSLTT